MPISKKEAIQRLNQQVYKLFSEYCNKIDDKLAESLSASFDLPTTFNTQQRDSLVEMLTKAYTDVGWIVKRNQGDDQRDGSWDYISIS